VWNDVRYPNQVRALAYDVANGRRRMRTSKMKIRIWVRGPGVVPRRSKFNSLGRQTVLSAITDSEDFLLLCKTSWDGPLSLRVSVFEVNTTPNVLAPR
jgi:hypothetical protein